MECICVFICMEFICMDFDVFDIFDGFDVLFDRFNVLHISV